jgi:hypothetical protein
MFSIPLRLALGILVLVVVPGLGALARRRDRPTQEPRAQVPPPGPLPAAGTSNPSPTSALSDRPPAPRTKAEPSVPTTGPTVTSTTHARLILDGQFAQRIGLVSALRELDVPGKTVRHAPQDHLITALANILAGHHQLQEISRGDNPLRGDLSLAQAWDQAQFPEVSGVCPQLHEADWSQAEAVREQLRRVFAPYISLCAGPTLARGQRLVVDWDFTAKQITTEAQSEPFATYGHMEDGLGRGYQWAEAVLRGSGPDGRDRAVSLGGFLCPGNAHPDGCLKRLQAITETTLGRPRRRPDLLGIRLALAQNQAQGRQEAVSTLQAKQSAEQTRFGTWTSQLQAIEQRRVGRRADQQTLLARDERAKQAAEKHLAAGQKRLEALRGRLAEADHALVRAQGFIDLLQAHLLQLEADNAALDASQQPGVAIEVNADSQFGGSEMVAELREAGYDVTTKAISPATMTKLLRREQEGERVFGPWKEVTANAEVAECLETTYAQCPYPWRLLGYRKHLAGSASRPAQTNHALFMTSVPTQERTAEETVQHYHVRGGTAELLNRQAKSNLGFRGHRLRHAPGLEILGQFVFAGLNFVPWLADTVWAESDSEAGERPGLAELTQMARAPGHVLADEDGVAVQFSQDGGWPQRTLRLGVLRQPTLPGFVWPGVPVDAQLRPQTCKHDVVARKLG